MSFRLHCCVCWFLKSISWPLAVLIWQIVGHIQKSKAQHRHSCFEQITKKKQLRVSNHPWSIPGLQAIPAAVPMLPHHSPNTHIISMWTIGNTKALAVLGPNKISDERQWNIIELQQEGLHEYSQFYCLIPTPQVRSCLFGRSKLLLPRLHKLNGSFKRAVTTSHRQMAPKWSTCQWLSNVYINP